MSTPVGQMNSSIRSRLAPYITGDVPLARVFVRDMLIVGTVINMLTGGMALIAYAEGASGWLAIGMVFAPLPYNLALCVLVWRSASLSSAGWRDAARAGSALWLLAMCIA